jgi:hypothetical protein
MKCVCIDYALWYLAFCLYAVCCMYVCTYARTHLCVCIYVCIYIYKTHLHIQASCGTFDVTNY